MASDFGFQPQVAKDHISAYFRKKLVFGAFAYTDNTLTAQDGDIIDFPFYSKIGAAEKPAESSSLTVDNLTDGSFQATVFEVGKAVGFTKKSLRKHAKGPDGAFMEASAQIAQVHAELLEDELVTVMDTASNHDEIFTASADTNLMTIRLVNQVRLTGFGDRADEAVVWYCHSLNFLDFLNDTTAGFLKMDANDPFYSVPGFQGRLFGMAVVVTDNVPREADISGKRVYASYIAKGNAYGFMEAQAAEIEDDYDLLARQYVMTGNQWYAVRGFHKAISTDDARLLKFTAASSVSA
jgi:hypothetical protein